MSTWPEQQEEEPLWQYIERILRERNEAQREGSVLVKSEKLLASECQRFIRERDDARHHAAELEARCDQRDLEVAELREELEDARAVARHIYGNPLISLGEWQQIAEGNPWIKEAKEPDA